MMQNCFGLSVGFGICGALDTLVSQAYGAGQHEVTCYYLQRCRVIVALQLVWMIPLLWFSQEWLTAIHQDAEVARDAGEYNRASVWGLFAVFQFEAMRHFLQNRGRAMPAAAICGITALVHPIWCMFLVLHCGLGNAGAGYANAITWWLQFLCATIYLACNARNMGLSRRGVLGIQLPGLQEWGSYMKLAVPSVIQLCSEWWFWEVNAIIVGYLGETALAAHVATMNFVALSFMPTIGINVSTATLVGNALGAGLPRKAKKTVFTCVAFNLCVWTVLAIGTLLGRGLLAEAYSSDHEVQELMQKLLCVFALVGFFDTSQNIMGAGLRGMGLQTVAAWTYIIMFYGVMLPIGCVGAFKLGMGVFGVWYSFVIGTSAASLVFVLKLCRTNYGAVAAEAAWRIDRDTQLGQPKTEPSDSAGVSTQGR